MQSIIENPIHNIRINGEQFTRMAGRHYNLQVPSFMITNDIEMLRPKASIVNLSGYAISMDFNTRPSVYLQNGDRVELDSLEQPTR